MDPVIGILTSIVILAIIYLCVWLILRMLIRRRIISVLISSLIALIVFAVLITWSYSKWYEHHIKSLSYVDPIAAKFFHEHPLRRDSLLGMTKPQVFTTLGLPEDTAGDRIVYTIEPYYRTIVLFFKNGTVIEVEK